MDSDDSELEVKANLMLKLETIECDLLSKLEAKLSNLVKLRKAIVIVLQLNKILLKQVRLEKDPTTKGPVNIEMLQEARNTIIKLVQNKHFKSKDQKIRQLEGSLGKEISYQH